MARGIVRQEIEKLNIRTAMSTAPGTDVGDVFPLDILLGSVLGNWFAFDKVVRKSTGQIELFPNTVYAAIANPLNLSEKYLTIETTGEEPAPPTIPPAPVFPLLELTIGGAYDVVTLEQRSTGVYIQLKPK